ncbi:hypothetical protein BVX97_02615 [bacterium E08(2017)]|nr:hypothetical protein BVX97_02615 [bacterium E08(2017)]
MARQLRVEYSGAIYHVTCRMLGDAKSRLFIDDADRQRFLESLSDRVEQYNIRLYMFVLMTNHFHLVFETPEGNCSKFMQSLLTSYTVYYNLRHRRHGHLFDGRYKAKLVDGDDYLLALTRYVHLNPVHISTLKNKTIDDKRDYLRQYAWSSYQSYIGKRKQLPYVEYAPLLAEMPGKVKERPKRYREYVESSLAETDEEFIETLKESPRSIGGDQFRAWVDELYQKLIEKSEVTEDIAFRRITEPLNPDVVLAVIAEKFEVETVAFKRRKRKSPLRAIAAKYLIKYSGMNQRDVADYLDVGSGDAVSKQMIRYKELLSTDRQIGEVLGQVGKVLDELKAQSNGVQ